VIKNFAGINLNANQKIADKPDALNMSLKQYLVAQDRINFQNNFGQLENQD
jgi:hypothetical protein